MEHYIYKLCTSIESIDLLQIYHSETLTVSENHETLEKTSFKSLSFEKFISTGNVLKTLTLIIHLVKKRYVGELTRGERERVSNNII